MWSLHNVGCLYGCNCSTPSEGPANSVTFPFPTAFLGPFIGAAIAIALLFLVIAVLITLLLYALWQYRHRKKKNKRKPGE
jgi:heme/copper-type cytochrome/quinol oxidase subunit 2